MLQTEMKMAPAEIEVAARDAVLVVSTAEGARLQVLHRASELSRQFDADIWLLHLSGGAWNVGAHDPILAIDSSDLARRQLVAAIPPGRVIVRASVGLKSLVSAAKSVPRLRFMVLPAGLKAHATALARETRAAVLVANDETRTHVVLAASDLADAHYPVLRWGADLATRFASRLVFVHNVAPDLATVPPGFYPLIPGVMAQEAVVRSRRSLLGAAAAKVAPSGTCVVESRNDTADAVLAAARACDADLIVVGAHVRNWFDRILRPSAASEVVRCAVRSVLVVPLMQPRTA